jgi:hypothetical protein
MLYRSINEIIEAALINTKARIRDLPKKTPIKYKYKENLKSRRSRK